MAWGAYRDLSLSRAKRPVRAVVSLEEDRRSVFTNSAQSAEEDADLVICSLVKKPTMMRLNLVELMTWALVDSGIERESIPSTKRRDSSLERNSYLTWMLPEGPTIQRVTLHLSRNKRSDPRDCL